MESANKICEQKVNHKRRSTRVSSRQSTNKEPDRSRENKRCKIVKQVNSSDCFEKNMMEQMDGLSSFGTLQQGPTIPGRIEDK